MGSEMCIRDSCLPVTGRHKLLTPKMVNSLVSFVEKRADRNSIGNERTFSTFLQGELFQFAQSYDILIIFLSNLHYIDCLSLVTSHAHGYFMPNILKMHGH